MTVITTFLVEPMHPSGLLGVTIYVAVCGEVVVLVSTSVIGSDVPGVSRAVPPVIFPGAPEIVGAGQ